MWHPAHSSGYQPKSQRLHIGVAFSCERRAVQVVRHPVVLISRSQRLLGIFRRAVRVVVRLLKRRRLWAHYGHYLNKPEIKGLFGHLRRDRQGQLVHR